MNPICDEDTLRESRLRFREYFLENEHEEPTPSKISESTKDKFQRAVIGAVSFQRGEANTIRRVLEEIDTIALKRTKEGFNEVNFTIGVLNCLFISYVFGAYPQHLWLLYFVEGAYMIPRKFYNMWNAKPLNQALYYLDFCWCMNFTSMLYLALLIATELVDGLHIDDSTRETFMKSEIGVNCGTLMGANIVLPFVACLFHDLNTMTGFFIHIMPPLVTYTFMWHSAEIKETWPSLFDLSHLSDMHYFPTNGSIFVVPGTELDSIVGNAIVLYLAWWMPYVIFMLLGGLDLPKKFQADGVTPANPKFDTVFHSTMRGGPCITIGKIFRGRSKKDSLQQMEENSFDLIDFFIYMGFHMLSAILAVYVIGYPCFISQNFHLFMLIVITVLAVTRGAQRYTYYSTRMYSRALRRQFAYVLDSSKES
mmetsp:Transcript_33596/g.69059  ORF Transcript_33596/g.69059 Transcript_33596/m.69059 type:complete len:423 (+) Transcript_33596:245-1513(+)